MGFGLAWFPLVVFLLTVGSLGGITWAYYKKVVKGKTAVAMLSIVVLLLVFTPIKLDNSVQNKAMITSFDKTEEVVDIKTEARVEYSAQTN